MIRDVLSNKIENLSYVEDSERNYIGASGIGSDCWRQIWYQFKGEKAEGVPSKMRRTWDIGKKLEHLVIEWLLSAGVSIQTTDFTYTAKDMPYFQGHFDGILLLLNERAILEIKTAKDASFKVFVKKGIKAWNPQYYAQIQAYMGMSGIHRAYIIVLNKDSSELSDEPVEFDFVFYEGLMDKARMIHGAVVAPPRINGSALFFKCKMCKYNKLCHE